MTHEERELASDACIIPTHLAPLSSQERVPELASLGELDLTPPSTTAFTTFDLQLVAVLLSRNPRVLFGR